jgi:hypothetical protein
MNEVLLHVLAGALNPVRYIKKDLNGTISPIIFVVVRSIVIGPTLLTFDVGYQKSRRFKPLTSGLKEERSFINITVPSHPCWNNRQSELSFFNH